MTDRNDLAFWFPILSAIPGVVVPRTEILTTDLRLDGLCYGETPDGFDDFCTRLLGLAYRIGEPPYFLRSGQTSGKHDWKRTCFLERPEDIPSHVAAIVEYGEAVSFIGLPTRTWAVREFLDLEASFTAFNGMPVAKEFRCFFGGGNPTPICLHPYWPPAAVHSPSVPDWRERLAAMNWVDPVTELALRDIVALVAPHFDGRWSLDVAFRKGGGLIVTDMAEMDRSFHWDGCPNAPPDCTRAEAEDRAATDGFVLADGFDLAEFFRGAAG